jgi:hypothetical protein
VDRDVQRPPDIDFIRSATFGGYAGPGNRRPRGHHAPALVLRERQRGSGHRAENTVAPPEQAFFASLVSLLAPELALQHRLHQ